MKPSQSVFRYFLVLLVVAFISCSGQDNTSNSSNGTNGNSGNNGTNQTSELDRLLEKYAESLGLSYEENEEEWKDILEENDIDLPSLDPEQDPEQFVSLVTNFITVVNPNLASSEDEIFGVLPMKTLNEATESYAEALDDNHDRPIEQELEDLVTNVEKTVEEMDAFTEGIREDLETLEVPNISASTEKNFCVSTECTAFVNNSMQYIRTNPNYPDFQRIPPGSTISWEDQMEALFTQLFNALTRASLENQLYTVADIVDRMVSYRIPEPNYAFVPNGFPILP